MKSNWTGWLGLAFLLSLLTFVRPDQEISVEGRERSPGEILLVAVIGQDDTRAPSGSFHKTPLSFFRAGHGTYLAFVGLDLDVPIGPRTLTVESASPGRRPRLWRRDIVIREKKFPTQRLTTDPRFVHLSKKDQERAAREAKSLKALFARRTQERYFKGGFITPIEGASSSRFGSRRIFNNVPRRPHSGADLRAKSGEPIRASAGGKVVLAESLFFSGNAVLLDHGCGLSSFYAHLSTITVRVGDKVDQGEIIGEVGASGRVTGPHLHWAVKLGGARVDPFSLTALDLDGWLKSPTR